MTAEAKVRALTWTGIATGVIGILLVAFPTVLPAGGPWVQLALGIVTLVVAFRARKLGIAEVDGFDGRLSLAAALLGFAVVFFAGQVVYGLLAAATS